MNAPALSARYSYDPVRFIEALGKIKKPKEPVKLLVNKDDSLRLRAARDIAKMLTECGLETVTVEKNSSDFQKFILAGNYDMYLGQTRLSPNMDLTPFFKPMGTLRYGNIADPSLLALCQQAMANIGNYYNLHENVMNDGRVVPILFHRYSVHATRGLLTGLTPARDNVFCYTIGKTLADVRREE